MPRLPLFLCLALTLAGCSTFPTLDAAVGPEAKRAPYPRLAPLSEVLGTTQTDPAQAGAAADPASQLGTRATALRARARALYATPPAGG